MIERKARRRSRRIKPRRGAWFAPPRPLALAIRAALRRPLGLTSALTLSVMLSTGGSEKALAKETQALKLNTPVEQRTLFEHGLVVIDPSVPNYRSLLSGVRPGFQVVVLDANRDGFAQLGAILKAHPRVRSVHLLAHGSPGALRLGNAWVRREDLEEKQAALSSWFVPGPTTPELILYGCNVAQGEGGQAFVARLSALIGADVAASEDVTGSRASGGDWVLEHKSGPIESPLAFSPQALTAYPGVLDTFIVDNLNDTVDTNPGDGVCLGNIGKCTLRAAVMEANALAGADTIILPAATFTLTLSGIGEDGATTGDLDIRSDITIQGAGKSQTVVDANGLDRVLQVHFNASLTLEQATITGGKVTGSFPDNVGGGIHNFSTVTLTNSTISGNSAVFGAGIYSRDTATLTDSIVSGNTANNVGGGIRIFGTAYLNNSIVSNNSAENRGGGIHNDGSATLTSSTVSGNSAGNDGGGIFNAIDAFTTLDASDVLSNSANGDGGGISNSLNASATLTDTTVSGNSAGRGGGIINVGSATFIKSTVSGNSANSGGGMFNRSGGAAQLANSEVSGNSAASGGGIYNQNGAVTLSSSNVFNNSANSGGGIRNTNGTATLENSMVSGNWANFTGGGISNQGTATLNQSTVSGNSASRDGGGIWNASYGTATLTNSTISGNSAGIRGGGISNFFMAAAALMNSTVSGNSANFGGGIYSDATETLSNSTISGNSATYGGGLYNNGTAALSNSTVSGNSANFGGGLYNLNGTATLSNSLISGNTAPNGDEIGNGGTVNADSSNVFGHSSSAQSFGFTPGSSDIVPSGALNTVLDPNLTDNGGPTETHALVFGSNAIDTVICAGSPATDQRGIARPQPVGGNCDIGAYEFADADADGIADERDAFPFVNQGAVVITIINSILLDD